MAFIELSALLQEPRDQRCPPGLVAGADTRSGVSVEVLVKGNQIVPVGIGLEPLDRPKDRPATPGVIEEHR